MKTQEYVAKSVEEAVKLAAADLHVAEEELNVEVLEAPSKGFLGLLGGKQARIRVLPKANNSFRAISFLEEVTAKMGAQTKVTIEEEDEEYLRLAINGESLGLLIGRRGETLDALQYLTNLVANRHSPQRRKIIIDAENYRKRREDTLVKLAGRLAERVKRTGHRVVLEPMNPQERRIIHTALQNEPYVQTISEGEEPYRKVVISLRRAGR